MPTEEEERNISAFVPYKEYIDARLKIESQIATNTQKLLDVSSHIDGLFGMAKDTNDKVTQHILDENNVWIEIKSDLKILKDKVKNPSIRIRTLYALFFSIAGLALSITYLFLRLRG